CGPARQPTWRSRAPTPRCPRAVLLSCFRRARARMSQAEEIAPLIRGLCDADPSQRERAAAEIFRRGGDLARAAASKWLANPQLARAFVLDDSHFPETTVGLAVEPENFD